MARDHSLLLRDTPYRYQQDYRCTSNETTALGFVLATLFLDARNFFSKIVQWGVFFQHFPQCSLGLRKICEGVIEIF